MIDPAGAMLYFACPALLAAQGEPVECRSANGIPPLASISATVRDTSS
jgi:hypothetical protein